MRVQATPKKPLAGLPSDASTESQVSMVLFLTDFALPVTIGTHASYRDIVRRSGLADFSASKVEIMTQLCFRAIVDDIRGSIRADAGGVVSITTDHWSNGNRSCIGVTAHYIDRHWRLRFLRCCLSFVLLVSLFERCLSFGHRSEVVGILATHEVRQVSDNVKELVIASLDATLGGETTIFGVTTDNASNMLKMNDELSGGSGTGIGCVVRRDAGSTAYSRALVSCVCHKVNLCVVDVIGSNKKRMALADADGNDDDNMDNDDDDENVDVSSRHDATFHLVSRVNATVATVRRHKRARSLLEQLQLNEGVSADRVAQLQLPNDTRWHSQLASLNSFLGLRPYLKRMTSIARVARVDGEPLD